MMAWGGEDEIYKGQIKAEWSMLRQIWGIDPTLSFLRSSLPSLPGHAPHSISFSKDVLANCTVAEWHIHAEHGQLASVQELTQQVGWMSEMDPCMR